MRSPVAPNNRLMSREAGFAYLFKKFPVFAQTFIAREVEGMERHGFRPDIYALQPAPPADQEGFANLRQRVRVLPGGAPLAAGIIAAGLGGRLPAAAFFSGVWLGGRNRRRREAFWLGPRLRAAGTQHVHTHFTGPAARTAWCLRQDFGISYSITAHANDFLSDADEHPGMERLLTDASFVVAVSDYSRKLLAERFPRARVVRVYNGMRFDNAPAPSPAALPRLVAVGRLVEKKGYPLLIESCALLKRNGVDFHCEIIGDGPLESELRGQIAAYGLGAEVQLAGPRTQPEIRSSLAAASVFVLPCVEEKSGGMDILPTVITEAMAASLPVVSTRLAGIPEMVVDGKTGFLVAPGDAQAVANAVQKLLSNPGKARAMGAAGRRHAEAIFSEGVTIPQLLALLGQKRNQALA
jgi:colanic acid/amylovoran biosynthesis glycosyltransferase